VIDAKLNNKAYTKNYLNHSDIINGGNLELQMGQTPNKQKGILQTDFPYSMTNEILNNR